MHAVSTAKYNRAQSADEITDEVIKLITDEYVDVLVEL